MNDIKIYESIADDRIISEINNMSWCKSLFDYATIKCQIDGLISAGNLFCPNIIQIKEYIFIEKFWNISKDKSINYIEKLEKQYNFDKRLIEMFVNSWSIGDLFVGDNRDLMDNIKVLKQFGNILVYFWRQRVKELFPNKDIRVYLGENLMGEYGLSITMYENVR